MLTTLHDDKVTSGTPILVPIGSANATGPTRPSLAGRAFRAHRAVLKVLVQADGSRSPLHRLRAAAVLLAALSGFAALGYIVPMLVF